MAIALKLRRGTTAENDAFLGSEAELTYDTDTKGLRIHDGATIGGNIIDTVVFFQAPTAENNYTWARKYASGWVEQGGRAGTGTANPNPRNVVFPVEMADTNYHILGNPLNSTDNSAVFCMQPRNLTTTGMSVYCTYSANHGSGGSGETYCWQVSGMAA